MMKLNDIFKDEANAEDEKPGAWLRKLLGEEEPTQPIPQFLALCFNHNAGQMFFAPVVLVPQREMTKRERYDHIDETCQKHLGHHWQKHKAALFPEFNK